MKYLLLFFGIALIPLSTYAQINQPDTLQLDIKSGQKIILIGTDLNSFKTLKTDSIIRKALLSVQDSLVGDSVKPRKKTKAELYTKVLKHKRPFLVEPVIGAGLLKDKISPFMGISLDFAPQRQDYFYRGTFPMYTFFNLAISVNYTFDKDATNTSHTHTNIFIEGSFGNRINNRTRNVYIADAFSFGAGYLVRNQGGYFQKNTFKIFGTILARNSFVHFKPEIYITDDFKKVFPGLSVKARFL